MCSSDLIGYPGTGATCQILHIPFPGGLGPAGIGRVVGEQGKQEVGSQQCDGDQDGLEDPLGA